MNDTNDTRATEAGSFAAVSDVGRVRTNNEDYAYAGPLPGCEGWVLLLVADGVGGHGHGEWASQLAVERVAVALAANLDNSDPAAALAKTIEETSHFIWEEAQRIYAGAGPATTLVAALVKDDLAWWANVGDSRIYLIHAGAGLVQLSDDHSWVADQVRAGHLTEAEAEAHPHRNIITRTVGFEPDVRADSGGPIQLAAGDSLVICSDGLHGLVSDATIGLVASQLEPEPAAERLVELANEAGGRDNVTVVVYRAATAGAAIPAAPEPEEAAPPLGALLETQPLPPTILPTSARPARSRLAWAVSMLVSAALAGGVAAAALWWFAP